MNASQQRLFRQAVIRLFVSSLLSFISVKIVGAGDRFAFLRSVKPYDKMIEYGQGWDYVEYKKDGRLAEPEAKARDQMRGLWFDTTASFPPWEYRKVVDEAHNVACVSVSERHLAYLLAPR